MSEPYLIAHLVRGQPAFDIAERMECPCCAGSGYRDDAVDQTHCDECDGEGFWWICSTSGHRARPYAWHQLDMIRSILAPGLYDDPPPNWPDHFPTTSPKATKGQVSNLLAKLGLGRAAPIVKRRI